MNQNHRTFLFVVFLLMATNLSFAMYDTHTGRFMQQDPLGIQPASDIKINPFKPEQQYSDSTSLYQPEKSNPIIYTDPQGLLAINGLRKYIWQSTWWAPPHGGFFVDGEDIDFGPGKRKGWIYEGKCPWSGRSQPNFQGRLMLKRKVGIMKHGPKAGARCQCTTAKNVKDCVRALCKEWNGPGSWYQVGLRDCSHFVERAGLDCCFKAYDEP